MWSPGFKSYIKSISLGNLSMSGDANNDTEDDTNNISSKNSAIRSDKHNLSSINEQIRDIRKRLREVSEDMALSSLSVLNLPPPPPLPTNNLEELQNAESREVYQQQSAVWELLLTEQNFLRQISFIVQIYENTLEKLISEFFPNINPSLLFNNIKEIYSVSLDFWRETMQPMLEDYQKNNTIIQPSLMKSGFEKIGVILEPYILYCTEIASCRTNISSLEKKNELFAEYTKWAMEREESNREILQDHLAKPFLRLTKYKILLLAVHKHTNENEKTDISEMIQSVDNFVSDVNEKVDERNLQKKLEAIASQIESYSVIETLGEDVQSIMSAYSRFDITTKIRIAGANMIRQLTYHGEVKMRESSTKMLEVKLMLFTDILLVTRSRKKSITKVKVIRPPLNIKNMEIHKCGTTSFACVVTNKFNCISAFYVFSCPDFKKCSEWIQKMKETKERFVSLLLSGPDILLTDRGRAVGNTVPGLTVEQSSPQHDAIDVLTPQELIHLSLSTSELDTNPEKSFRRQAPVAKKHKVSKKSSGGSSGNSANKTENGSNSFWSGLMNKQPHPIQHHHQQQTSSTSLRKNSYPSVNVTNSQDTEFVSLNKNIKGTISPSTPTDGSQLDLRRLTLTNDCGSSDVDDDHNSELLEPSSAPSDIRTHSNSLGMHCSAGGVKNAAMKSRKNVTVTDSRKSDSLDKNLLSLSRQSSSSSSSTTLFNSKLDRKMSISLNLLDV